MEGIKRYGTQGDNIAQTAQRLHDTRGPDGKPLVTAAELKELTNATFSQRDFQAADAAITRARAIPGYSEAFKDAVGMHGNLVGLRNQMEKDPTDPKMTMGQAFGDLFKVLFQ